MKHLFKHIYIIGVIFAIIATTAACSVKYAFNGASIDYTKTKTIELADPYSQLLCLGTYGTDVQQSAEG